MYSTTTDKPCEEICYEDSHIDKVMAEIKKNFDPYFIDFLETSAGTTISSEQFKALQQKFGTTGSSLKSTTNYTEAFKNIFAKSIEAYEKDREKYIKLLEPSNLEEYQYDPAQFKNQALKNECPIIHGTIMNRKAKELDGYRKDFNRASANDLLQVFMNISEFVHSYRGKYYKPENYLSIKSYKDLNLEIMDQEGYFYYGVLGGGIKSLILYKFDPEVFSYRSKNAIWSLWYLSNKQKFECKQDSEFLIIDLKHIVTKQNYYYPYELFSKYAFEIFKLLNEKAKELNVNLNPEYRYVIVDAFFEHVANKHAAEIAELSHEFNEDGFDYGTMGY